MRLFPSGLPSLPLKVDEFGHLEKVGKVIPAQTAKKGMPGHFVAHPSPPRPHKAYETQPSLPRIDVSQEVATEAIRAIADICSVTVDELREICGNGPDFIDSLGLDSLLSLEVIDTMTKLGVNIPRTATGSYFQEDFQCFLGSFILEYIDAADVTPALQRKPTFQDSTEEHVCQALVQLLSELLSIPREEIDINDRLHRLGIDSLVAVDIRRWIFQTTSAEISLFDLLGNHSAKTLSSLVASKCQHL